MRGVERVHLPPDGGADLRLKEGISAFQPARIAVSKRHRRDGRSLACVPERTSAQACADEGGTTHSDCRLTQPMTGGPISPTLPGRDVCSRLELPSSRGRDCDRD
jgi:hypothetical protein